MNFRNLVGALFALLLLATTANAAELGVNYYHESLMSPWSDGPYIKRSLSEVGQDFDNIKQISNNVKLYMNPFVDGNLQWNEQVAAIAKGKGMRVVVNMMVDDRYLDDSNWNDYANRVVDSCSALNGKVDEVLVGNEITLHSPLSRTDIRDRVIALMDRCKQVYGGDVSYEEFWYAKDVWKGYNGRLYFMMYEGLDAFRSNIQEMDSSWGSNAYVGEWGEDQLEDRVRYDEQWQKDQIQKRWEIIQQTRTPVAYIFTYREPNEEAFGIIRGDGSRRPLWDVFGAPSQPVQQPAPQPVEQPQAEPTPEPVQEPAPPVTQPAPVEQPAQDPAPQPVEQTPVQPTPPPAEQTPAPSVPAAQPTTPVQEPLIPWQTPAMQPTAPPLVPAEQPASAPVQQPQGSSSGSVTLPTAPPIDLLELPLTCAAHQECSVVHDATTGSCRSVVFQTGATAIPVLACDKGDGNVEVYLQSVVTAPFAACFGNGCVTTDNGFMRFTP